MKRRTYTEPRLQLLYVELRAKRPDPAKVRGAGGIGNAYAVGYTKPDADNRLFPRGSRSYVAWAAGVDNAQDDRKAAATRATGADAE